MTIRAYTLPAADAARALEAGGPLADLGADPAALAKLAIAVVEVDGRIVAYWVVSYALHVEPLWVVPEYRRHPGVIRGIVAEMQRIVVETQEPAAFCVIDQQNLAVVEPYAARLGFQAAPGQLFYVVVQPPPGQEY